MVIIDSHILRSGIEKTENPVKIQSSRGDMKMEIFISQVKIVITFAIMIIRVIDWNFIEPKEEKNKTIPPLKKKQNKGFQKKLLKRSLIRLLNYDLN